MRSRLRIRKETGIPYVDLPMAIPTMKETSPAPGFATTDQVQEFTFEYGGQIKTLSYVFYFEDEPTTVEFTKTS